MRVNNWISFGCVMAAIAIGVAIAVMLSDIATVKAGWCDARPACFRDWFSALSGWAAGAGALVAAWLTVPHLKRQASESARQVDEAKRQADLLLGESDPTMDVVEHLVESGELVIRIINWNRRSIFVDTPQFSTKRIEVQLLGVEINKADYDCEFLWGSFAPAIPVEGWIDRSSKPSVVEIRIQGISCVDGEIIERWNGDVEVIAGYRTVGAVEPSERLTSRILAH